VLIPEDNLSFFSKGIKLEQVMSCKFSFKLLIRLI